MAHRGSWRHVNDGSQQYSDTTVTPAASFSRPRILHSDDIGAEELGPTPRPKESPKGASFLLRFEGFSLCSSFGPLGSLEDCQHAT